MSEIFDGLTVYENFQVECLGEVDGYVYDIEVDDTHRFFANGILVHNSVYFCLDPVIQKFNIPKDQRRVALEKITRDIITPMVNGICQECCDKMGSYENKISFKLEVSAPSADDGIGAVWVGKKKYALKVESSEGVVFDKPKFKVKGLEMVRSSTPKFIRDHLKDSLPLIFDGTEKQVQEYIEKTRQEFYTLPYERVAFPRSANNLIEYSDPNSIYRKATPIAVRGALLYNHHLKRLGLTGKYRLITEGMKVRFAYLKTPNVLHENIIAFPVDGEIPVEFGIIDKIDYETQYQKTMIDAMQIILTAIGWNAIETSSLDDFFG
jgi:DNA polymerase elongation subunit (family B)